MSPSALALILSSDGEQLQVLYEFHPIGGVGDRTVFAVARSQLRREQEEGSRHGEF
jgi:hypothetical protein